MATCYWLAPGSYPSAARIARRCYAIYSYADLPKAHGRCEQVATQQARLLRNKTPYGLADPEARTSPLIPIFSKYKPEIASFTYGTEAHADFFQDALGLRVLAMPADRILVLGGSAD